MFREIIRLAKFYRLKAQNNNSGSEQQKKSKFSEIPDTVKEISDLLKSRFSECSDFITRQISIGKDNSRYVLLAFIDGLANKRLINSDILKPLMAGSETWDDKDSRNMSTLDAIEQKLICTCEIEKVSNFEESISDILSGDTLIYIDGCSTAIKAGLRDWEKRSVEEPSTDSVVRGPREGFTETLRTNTSLLRRKIKNANLKFETIKVGEQTNTDVCICYIKGIANDEVINEVKERLRKIKTDAILESGYIEEFIQESTLCIFPTVGNSEKPDIVASKILEGRVAILCDGTPFVLTVPFLFVEAIQSSEDYYSRSIYSIANRFIRILALFITTMLPAYYVALVSFHHDIIPYKLLLTMTASREGIPFPALVEALTMVVTFELLREAGVRMPKAIGQAVSIVGALVIGDAAVKAGIISTPMVIIIAITAITSFIITPLAGALLIIRVAAMIAANIIGILGVILTSLAFFIDMCRLRSFGVNYLSPFTPLSGSDLKDTVVRFPLWAMLTRPKALTWEHGDNAKFRNKHNVKRK